MCRGREEVETQRVAAGEWCSSFGADAVAYLNAINMTKVRDRRERAMRIGVVMDSRSLWEGLRRGTVEQKEH